MSSKNLFLNASLGYGAMVMIMAISILIKILLARILSPSEMGLFIATQTLFGMLVFLGSLGLNDSITRFVGLEFRSNFQAAKVILSKCLRLELSIGVILVSIGFFFSYAISNDVIIDLRYSSVYIFFALAIPFKLSLDIIGSAYQGVGRLYMKLLISELFPSLFFVVALGVLVVFSLGSLTSVSFLFVIPIMVAPFLYGDKFNFISILRCSDSSVSTRYLLGHSIPLLLAGIVAWPLTLVPVVVGSMTSAESVANYSLAISLASFIYMGISATEAAGLSVWSSYLSSDKKNELKDDYRMSTRWGIIFASLVFIPLLLCPYEIVVILFGLKFVAVADILPAVSCIFFLNVVTGPTESILKAYGDTRFILLSRLIVGVVVLTTLYPALNIWGLKGAIAVYCLSMAIGGIGMYSYRLYAHYGLHPVDKYFLFLLLSIGNSALSSFLLLNYVALFNSEIFTIIKTFIFFCSFLGLHFFIFPTLSSKDRIFLSSIFSSACVLLNINGKKNS